MFYTIRLRHKCSNNCECSFFHSGPSIELAVFIRKNFKNSSDNYLHLLAGPRRCDKAFRFNRFTDAASLFRCIRYAATHLTHTKFLRQLFLCSVSVSTRKSRKRIAQTKDSTPIPDGFDRAVERSFYVQWLFFPHSNARNFFATLFRTKHTDNRMNPTEKCLRCTQNRCFRLFA